MTCGPSGLPSRWTGFEFDCGHEIFSLPRNWNTFLGATTHGCHLAHVVIVEETHDLAHVVDVAGRQGGSLTFAAGRIAALCALAVPTL